LPLSVILFMNIDIFQLFCAAVFTGSLLGLAFVVYKIITEEREKRLEESRIKIHWKDYPRECEQTGQPRGD
jgi:TRAP-type C4-dicarboxylate transport system permease large subunit